MILFGGEWYDSDKDKTYVYSVSAASGWAHYPVHFL